MYRTFQILVAEDDASDAFFIKRAFLKEGINAPLEFVPDGDQAVGYLDGRDQFADRTRFPLPKLLLLDLKMPKLGGFEVLQWVRNNPELRRLPALILSNSSLQDDIDRAHDLGANGYCVKPADLENMSQLVRGVAGFWFHCHKFPTIRSTCATQPQSAADPLG